jgi:hypothetical protein
MTVSPANAGAVTPLSDDQCAEANAARRCPLLAGFPYYKGPQLLDRLQPDVPLRLVLEPDNRYDQRAVRIEAFGHQIGYVPRADNQPISRLLVQEAPVQARVFTIGPRQPGFDSVMVAVSLRIF